MSIVFDEIISELGSFFCEKKEIGKLISPFLVNRDLNGRVCLIINKDLENDSLVQQKLLEVREILVKKLTPHVVNAEHFILFEEDFDRVIGNAPSFEVEWGGMVVRVVDRLASGADWSRNPKVNSNIPRIVFFSIKGGVGRSTALAVTAWSLAESGKKVLVLDLDLESPGLSSSLLPEDRRPDYGIVDWLVEDILNNGETVFSNMVATSDLSREGDIWVVPAYGRIPGEYIPKLGRIWMPKILSNGTHQAWTERLNSLLNQLEEKYEPDVILIDSRAGIDEIASASVTSLGASTVLLFAIDGAQTWSGYSILFEYWEQCGFSSDIGDKLQIIAPMIPDTFGAEYLDGINENAWKIFTEHLYSEIPSSDPSGDYFNFNKDDIEAPHHPLPILWNRGFTNLFSLYSSLSGTEPQQVKAVFGDFLVGIKQLIEV
jgi:hypothetical protein